MKLIVNDLAVTYEDHGKGPSILLLHGWQQSLSTFDQLSGLIQKDFRIIRLDLPGFGESEQPKETWGVEEYAIFVRAFCDKLDVEPEVILGHSFGGRVSIVLAAKELLHPRKVILVDSAGIAHHERPKKIALRAVAKFGKAVFKIPGLSKSRQSIREAFYTTIGSTDYITAGTMKDIFLKTIKQDLGQFAAQINQPTLLIWGAQDAVTPLEEGEQLTGLIANSQLEVLEGGHFVYLDQPKQVAKLIKDFTSA